jgi:hypothetical protein
MHIPRSRNLDLFRLPLSCLSALALLSIIGCTDALAESGPGQSRAAVFSDRLPGFDETLAREISGQVQAAGYATEFIGTTILTNRTLLTAKHYDLLVLPGARSLPMAAAPAIKGYLQEGGDLLALGLPAWQSPLYQIKGKWISRESYEEVIAAQRPQHIVEDFERAELSRWTRSAGEASAQAEWQGAAREGRALWWMGGADFPGVCAAFSGGPHADLFPRKGRPTHTPTRARMAGRGRVALDCDGGFDPGVEGLHAAAGPVQSLASAGSGREPRPLPPGESRELLCADCDVAHGARRGQARVLVRRPGHRAESVR